MTLIDAMRARRLEAHRLANVVKSIADDGLGDALRLAFGAPIAEPVEPCLCALLGQLCDHDEPPAIDTRGHA